MPTEIQTLQELDIFKGLKHEELGQITSLMHPMRVTEGEVLMRRGNPASTFFVVLSGNFMVHFKNGQAITLHKKGDIMGWSAVITPFQYTGTAVALTDGEVLSMSGGDFMRLIQENAALSDKIMQKINIVVTERTPFISGTKPEKDN
ncbi:MAG: hypothetical protein B6245_02870 [Desulfobacteraceae bacterium 4572_88]|nr:MAG: hypothetical protein B6245_02870 [Desulfobacteraceae bacterium 4572_88]